MMCRRTCNKPLVAFAALALFCVAAVARADPVIIPCEGPNMPAACPLQNTPPQMAIDQQSFVNQQAMLLAQQQQLAARRQALPSQMYQAYQAGLARQKALQPIPLNPLLAPPDIKAAARVVGGIITGNATPP
jgi:hypothetical protein